MFIKRFIEKIQELNASSKNAEELTEEKNKVAAILSDLRECTAKYETIVLEKEKLEALVDDYQKKSDDAMQLKQSLKERIRIHEQNEQKITMELERRTKSCDNYRKENNTLCLEVDELEEKKTRYHSLFNDARQACMKEVARRKYIEATMGIRSTRYVQQSLEDYIKVVDFDLSEYLSNIKKTYEGAGVTCKSCGNLINATEIDVMKLCKLHTTTAALSGSSVDVHVPNLKIKNDIQENFKKETKSDSRRCDSPKREIKASLESKNNVVIDENTDPLKLKESSSSKRCLAKRSKSKNEECRQQ